MWISVWNIPSCVCLAFSCTNIIICRHSQILTINMFSLSISSLDRFSSIWTLMQNTHSYVCVCVYFLLNSLLVCILQIFFSPGVSGRILWSLFPFHWNGNYRKTEWNRMWNWTLSQAQAQIYILEWKKNVMGFLSSVFQTNWKCWKDIKARPIY